MLCVCGIIQPSQEGAGEQLGGLEIRLPDLVITEYAMEVSDMVWELLINRPDLFEKAQAALNTLLASENSQDASCKLS